jgi:hypothetical protein
VLAEEVATAREALAAAEAAASEGAVSAARAARLSGELSEAHAEIRRLSELEGTYLLFSMHTRPGVCMMAITVLGDTISTWRAQSYEQATSVHWAMHQSLPMSCNNCRAGRGGSGPPGAAADGLRCTAPTGGGRGGGGGAAGGGCCRGQAAGRAQGAARLSAGLFCHLHIVRDTHCQACIHVGVIHGHASGPRTKTSQVNTAL